MNLNKNTVKVADIELDCFTSLEEAANYVVDHKTNEANILIAINPEKILASLEIPEVKNILVNATLRYMDGIGVVYLAQRRLGKKLARVPGCELWEAILSKLGSQKSPVYVLGADKSTVEKTVKKLKSEKGVNIVGFHDGYYQNDDEMIDEIIALKPSFLSVALGSPKQELFMQKCKERGADFCMMGVGGTYNVFTGKVKRAPAAWCKYNLEWLYRLLNEPTRIKRQLKLFKFIYLAIRKKI